MDTAQRNRQIKKVLSAKFGAQNVKVRMSRGTGYGWLHIKIAGLQDGWEHRLENEQICLDEISKAGLLKHVGTYGYDHHGSDYGYGLRMTFDFV